MVSCDGLDHGQHPNELFGNRVTNVNDDPAVGRPQRELIDVDRVGKRVEPLTEVVQVGLEPNEREWRLGCGSRQTKMNFEVKFIY